MGVLKRIQALYIFPPFSSINELKVNFFILKELSRNLEETHKFSIFLGVENKHKLLNMHIAEFDNIVFRKLLQNENIYALDLDIGKENEISNVKWYEKKNEVTVEFNSDQRLDNKTNYSLRNTKIIDEIYKFGDDWSMQNILNLSELKHSLDLSKAKEINVDRSNASKYHRIIKLLKLKNIKLNSEKSKTLKGLLEKEYKIIKIKNKKELKILSFLIFELQKNINSGLVKFDFGDFAYMLKLKEYILDIAWEYPNLNDELLINADKYQKKIVILKTDSKREDLRFLRQVGDYYLYLYEPWLKNDEI